MVIADTAREFAQKRCFSDSRLAAEDYYAAVPGHGAARGNQQGFQRVLSLDQHEGSCPPIRRTGSRQQWAGGSARQRPRTSVRAFWS
jgi:hypothetical protein